MNKNIYAVILAGGSGTRFWPLSRQRLPKQFLNILPGGSLFQQTLKRLQPLIPARNILVVTNAHYKSLVLSQSAFYRIPSKNILLEPSGKNTAPAIGWAASRIYSQDKNALMVVLPSDHLILNTKAFLKKLTEACRLAESGNLVTFGIVPTRPETGYGYLRTIPARQGRQSVLKVAQFVEKPPLPKAQAYLRKGNYLWNSGMFVWKVAVIREEMKNYLPDIFLLFIKNNHQAWANKIWSDLPSISIDYGILEKSLHVAAVAASDIGWSDVGSWEALTTVLAKDTFGNILRGDVVNVGSENTYVRADKKLVAAVGLKDIVIVDTPDALLVCRTADSQKVKDVTSWLKEKKRKEL